MLAPDLLNAFSLGLSVDMAQVWWIDWLFGGLAFLGLAWGMGSRLAIRNGGWVLPAFFVIPIAILLFLNEFSPVYMNARHMSLLVGAFVWRGPGLVGLATPAMGCWRDRRGHGAGHRLQHGELLHPRGVCQGRLHPFGRVYGRANHAGGRGALLPAFFLARLRVLSAPRACARRGGSGRRRWQSTASRCSDRPLEETETWLRDDIGQRFQRLWVIKSRTHPYFDLEDQIENWLKDHFLMVRNAQFFSHSSLRAQLYLPKIPVFDALPADVAHPVTVEFGDLIRLAGYTGTVALDSALPSPVKLYWQVLEKPSKRYKYILQLVEQKADGQQTVLSAMEREPYEGDIPTLYWDPGKTILEFVEMPPPAAPPAPESVLLLDLPDVRSRDAGEAAGDEGRGRGAAARRRDGAAAL